MIIDILQIRKIDKCFNLLRFFVSPAAFAIYLCPYYRARHDMGIGLFSLEIGRFAEWHNQVGIRIAILTWCWHWKKKISETEKI